MGDPEGLFPLSRGEIDFGFIGGAQIDKYGNVNSTFIGGDYNKPAKRLAGTAGAVDIGVFAKTTVTLMAHQKRRVVEKVDYLTTPGWMVKKWPGENWSDVKSWGCRAVKCIYLYSGNYEI